MHGRRSTKPLQASHDATKVGLPPLLVIHGGSDAVVATSNGHAAVHAWAQAGGACAGLGRKVQRGQRHATRIVDFKRRGVTMATLVEVERLRHAWSGGAPNERFSDNKGPDASRMTWAFTAKQFDQQPPMGHG